MSAATPKVRVRGHAPPVVVRTVFEAAHVRLLFEPAVGKRVEARAGAHGERIARAASGGRGVAVFLALLQRLAARGTDARRPAALVGGKARERWVPEITWVFAKIPFPLQWR